jgi:tRNA-modifying protein YgfZ
MTGVIARNERVLIRMYGRDPVKMIQGLATNDIAAAQPNQSVYTVFLTPKGKTLADARVLKRPNGDVWIEADRAAADNLAAHLKKTVPPLFARFEFMDCGVIEINGDNARTVADSLAHEAELHNPFRKDALSLVVAAGDVDTAISAAESAGAARLDAADLERMRIEAGEPKWGAELTEEVIPLEAGLREVAISEHKGCYTGQEVIIRILHRGHVNRHLRRVLVPGTDVPAAGTQLHRDSKAVGAITSAAFLPAADQVIALAYVRREVEPPAVLKMGELDVQVIELGGLRAWDFGSLRS